VGKSKTPTRSRFAFSFFGFFVLPKSRFGKNHSELDLWASLVQLFSQNLFAMFLFIKFSSAVGQKRSRPLAPVNSRKVGYAPPK